jgi:hypothetical protein
MAVFAMMGIVMFSISLTSVPAACFITCLGKRLQSRYFPIIIVNTRSTPFINCAASIWSHIVNQLQKRVRNLWHLWKRRCESRRLKMITMIVDECDMRYVSDLTGGTFDGLRIETVIPVSNIILTAETIGPEQETDGVKHASVIEHQPSAYETHETLYYGEPHQIEVRQMIYTGKTIPE